MQKIKYANATVMIEKLKSSSDDKNLIQSWLDENDVGCNYMKTKFVVCEKRPQKSLNKSIGDHKISPVNTKKYLGLHSDEMLNFKVHISESTGKLARQSGILYQLGETLNQSQLVQYL